MRASDFVASAISKLALALTAGVEEVSRALFAWEQCDVTGALVEACKAEVCDRRWRCLRELIEVVRAAEGE